MAAERVLVASPHVLRARVWGLGNGHAWSSYSSETKNLTRLDVDFTAQNDTVTKGLFYPAGDVSPAAAWPSGRCTIRRSCSVVVVLMAVVVVVVVAVVAATC